METKFIEGTNEQYSIREDSVVISNYANHYSYFTKSFTRAYRIKELKPNKNGKVNINIGGRKGIQKVLTVSKLMKEYYNGVKCHHCNNLITKKYFKVCDDCKKEILSKAGKEWKLANSDRIVKYQKNKVEKLPKHYVASLLGLKPHELTNDLYHHHRNLMMFKREICKNHDIKMQRLIKI
jgi:hypothetical protein